MLRGVRRHGTHAEQLRDFYAPQAASYDAFRERMLHGRKQLIDELPLAAGARVTELGGGTGRNLEHFGARLAGLQSVDVVDLCEPLLAIAEQRAAHLRAAWSCDIQLRTADVTTYRAQTPQDCVYFSYALTMIPDWRLAIDNAISMLRPGGMFAAVDFHVPGEGTLRDRLWQRWFAHDGVHLSEEHLPYLRQRLHEVNCIQARGRVPFLPGLRVPYYIFWGYRSA